MERISATHIPIYGAIIILATLWILSRIFLFLKNYLGNKNPFIADQEHFPAGARIFRALFILSFIVDLTIIGLTIGIPAFIILWVAQYVFYGESNPFYVFKKSEFTIIS